MSSLSGQIEIYEKAYQQAFTDSVISADERQLLDGLIQSLEVSSAQVHQIEARLGKKSLTPSINQEGRWRVTWQNMALGNGLYGFGIPYVLGIQDVRLISGIQLLTFAGGFYATWNYTKKMDLPYARSTFQNTGTALGFTSAYPLVAMIGFDNWARFDPDGKVFVTYQMLAVPTAIWWADRLYRRWEPSNGQATVISRGVSLGAFNTWGLYAILTDFPSIKNWETWIRINSILTYAGSLASGYYTYRFVRNRSYSQGDALFITGGSLLGAITYFELLALLEFDGFRTNMLAIMSTVNGYSYLADRMVKDVDLSFGDARMIGLGTLAGYLTWAGLALILDMDYSSDMARLLDLAAIHAGWYLTYNRILRKHRLNPGKVQQDAFAVQVNPSLIPYGKRWVPALQLKVRF